MLASIVKNGNDRLRKGNRQHRSLEIQAKICVLCTSSVFSHFSAYEKVGQQFQVESRIIASSVKPPPGKLVDPVVIVFGGVQVISYRSVAVRKIRSFFLFLRALQLCIQKEKLSSRFQLLLEKKKRKKESLKFCQSHRTCSSSITSLLTLSDIHVCSRDLYK